MPADLFDCIEALLRDVVGGLRLHQRGLGGVEIAARNRSLREELLAAVDDALVQIEVGLGLGEVGLRLGKIFRDLRACLGCIGALRGGVGALVVERGGLQVAVFERDQQLAGLHVRAALDVELLYRRGDLWRDGGLRQRRQHGVGGDLFGDAALRRMHGLHVDLGRWRGLLLCCSQGAERVAMARRRQARAGRIG